MCYHKNMNNDIIKQMLTDKAKTSTKEEALQWGVKYYKGIGVEQDNDIAYIFFERAASLGDAVAMELVAYMNLSGETDRRDVKKAFAYLTESSKKGYARADYVLGVQYHLGKLVKQDYKKAFEHFLKASKTDDDAMQMVGWCYEKGEGVEIDLKKAKEYYERAAEKNNIAAIYNLGCIYQDGKGVDIDYKKALDCFEKGAEMGHLSSIYNKGCFYYTGVGVEHNYTVAAECFTQAMKKGHAGAKCNLATMYINGLGVKKNITRGIRFLKELSDQGSNVAKCNLAIMIINKITDEDVSEAKRLLSEVNSTEGYSQVVKSFTMGCYEQYCLDGNEKSVESVRKAIEYFNDIVEVAKKSNDTISWQLMKGIKLSIVYEKLAECYLDLYYLSNINIENRNKRAIVEQEKYRKKAKEYLDLANQDLELMSPSEMEFLNSTIQLYQSILDGTLIDWGTISLADFQNKFEHNFPNIFLLAHKKKEDILSGSINRYLSKKQLVEDITQSNANEFEDEANKRYSLILKVLEKQKISNAESLLTSAINQKKQEIEKQKVVDFSDCVVDLDKFLEEMLHKLFITYKNEYTQEKILFEINDRVNNIVNSASGITEEGLREIVSVIHKQPVNPKFSANDCVKKIKQFVNIFNQNIKTGKFPTITIENLKQYLEDNKSTLSVQAISLIDEILTTADLKLKANETPEEKDFTIGQLFHSVYIDNTSGLSSTRRVINNEILDFVCEINQDKDKKVIELKINELIAKVELFRVIVRNVASHETILSQKFVEDGFALAMLQENSIFSLMEDLFGEYIVQKWVTEEFVKPILSNKTIDTKQSDAELNV